MNNTDVGKYIKGLREHLDMTQEELANAVGIGRDAIIRIEKGSRKISLNELRKISDLFNVDFDELLDAKTDDSTMKGIILAGGTGTRLAPITEATSKQLLSVYDKPMIYYPLSVLMQAGIKDILLITTKEDQSNFKRLLKDGQQFGINISYIIQPSPDGLAQAFLLGEEFIGNDPCAMILGDNIYFGNDFERELRRARKNAFNGYATIFGYKVKDPQRFGIMEVDKYNNVISVEEKPLEPKSDYAITGLYFYPKGVSANAKLVKPSIRNELEITSLNDIYLQQKLLKSSLLGDGYVWFDTGTFESLWDAGDMIRRVEDNKDTLICSPEIIAYDYGWISKDELIKRGELLSKNSYGVKLLQRAIKGGRNE